MYIEQDFVGPATLDLQANRKMKNRILRYWPKKIVDGVEILDKLYLYINGSVQKSANHLKIYNILGIKVADLDAEEWLGIENYYAYFKVMQGDQDNLEASVLEDYIDGLSPITEKSLEELEENDVSEWYSADIGYAPLKVPVSENVVSNADIIEKIKSDPYVATYSLSEEKLTALVLLDTDEKVFEKKFVVTGSRLVEVSSLAHTSKDNNTKVVKDANLTMTYRRKKVSSLVLREFTNEILVKIAAATRSIGKVLDTQLVAIYRDNVPFVDSDILLMPTIPDGSLLTSVVSESGYKVEGLLAMKAREFNQTITGRIDTDFTKKKVSWWKKLITVIVTIVIIVVAVVAAIPSGGGSLALAATILTVGSLAMMGLSIIIAKSDPAWGAYIGKMGQVLGVIASVVGILNIINQIGQAIAKEAVKEAAKQSLKEQGLEATKDALKQEMLKLAAEQTAMETIKDLSFDELMDALGAFIKASFTNTTQMTMSNMLSLATKGFDAYVKYIAPPDDGLDELSRAVEEQEEQLADYTQANLKDKIDYTFTSPFYNIYDFNEIMQGVPHSMTQGKIDSCFTKYYDGVTSAQKYKGYIG